MLKKSLVALAVSGALALPVLAQDWQMPRAEEPPTAEAPGGVDEPLGDLESELDGAMNQLFNRLQPHLNALGDELANTMNEFAPALNEISGLIDDIGNYERPERLENGDIIIRRRADAPAPPPLEELQRLLPDRDGRQPEADRPSDDPWKPLDPWRMPRDGQGSAEAPQTEL